MPTLQSSVLTPHTLSITENSAVTEGITFSSAESANTSEKPAAHPQEDQEYLLCVRCNLATCPGCD